MYLINLESQVNQENIFIIQVILLELHFFDLHLILKEKNYIEIIRSFFFTMIWDSLYMLQYMYWQNELKFLLFLLFGNGTINSFMTAKKIIIINKIKKE